MTKQIYRRSVAAPSLEAALDPENRTPILADAEARAAFLEKRSEVDGR